MTVLVVEDDADLASGLAELLEMDGARVLTAPDGEVGYTVFERERPDVVVSDLWMPHGTGYALVERIRQRPLEAGGLTPAIAISAAENVRTAILAGFHAFVPKPFDVSTLVDTIAGFFGSEPPQAVAPWTIMTIEPGKILITLVGRLTSGDVRALVDAALVHLENGPVDAIVDERGLESFAPAVARASPSARSGSIGVASGASASSAPRAPRAS